MNKQRAAQLYQLADSLSKLDVNTLSEQQLADRSNMIAKLQEAQSSMYSGADDTVGFSVSSEQAYNAVMARFSDYIDHDETSGIMYVPERLWPQVEEIAFDADGQGATQDHGDSPEQGVAEASNDYFKRRKDEEDRIAGTKAPAKRTPKQTDYEKKRKQQGVAEGEGDEQGYMLGKVLSFPDFIKQLSATLRTSNLNWKMTKRDDNVFLFSAPNDHNIHNMLVIAVIHNGWVSATNGVVYPGGEVSMGDKQELPMTVASVSEIAQEAIQSYHSLDLSDYTDESVSESEGDAVGVPHVTKELLQHIIQQAGKEGAQAIIKSLEWGDGAAKELLQLILKDLEQHIKQGVQETTVKPLKSSPKLTPVSIKKTETVSEEINNEAYERLQKVFDFSNYKG
jgi:hypothetical protein